MRATIATPRHLIRTLVRVFTLSALLCVASISPAQVLQPVTTVATGATAVGATAPIDFAINSVDGKIKLEKPVTFFTYRDQGTQKLVELKYQPTPQSVLKGVTYRDLKAKYAQAVANACAKGAPTDVVMDFFAEFAAFSVAVGLQSEFIGEYDPAAAAHFVQNQFLDPMSAPSFAGFVAGSRMMTRALQFTGAAYNPCINLQRGKFDVRRSANGTAQYKTPALTNSKGEIIRPETEALKQRNIYFEPKGPSGFQKLFGHMVGPMSLGAGLFVSNVIHELANDPNVSLCARSKWNPDIDPKTAEEACETAWEDWKLSKKSKDYTPDILAMGAASWIQAFGYWSAGKLAYGAARAAGVQVTPFYFMGEKMVTASAIGGTKEKTVELVLRAFRAGIAVGKWGSGGWGKLIMTAGNIFMFMEIVHPITPLIKQPFERSRQGNEITLAESTLIKEIDAAKNRGWSWRALTDEDLCPEIYNFDSSTMHLWSDGAPSCAVPEQHSPDKLLKRYQAQTKKWREFLLQESLTAHKNWTDYAGQFVADYTNSVNFYRLLALQLNEYKYDPIVRGKPTSDVDYRLNLLNIARSPFFKSDSIFSSEILRGISTGQKEKSVVANPDFVSNSSALDQLKMEEKLRSIMLESQSDISLQDTASIQEALAMALLSPENLEVQRAAPSELAGVKRARQFLEGFFSVKKNLETNSVEALTDLRVILNGLRALDPKVSIMQIASMSLGFRNLEGLKRENRIKIEVRQREIEYRRAIDVLYRVLRSPSKFYGDRGADFPSKYYTQAAEQNPFMKVRVLLGNPDPLPPGVGYIRRLNDESSVIVQPSKENHPKSIGLALTPTMTDYLVASMVCGPEVENSGQVLSVIESPVRQSYFANLWQYFTSSLKMEAAGKESTVVVDHPIVQLPKASTVNPAKNEGTVFSEWRSVRANFHPPRIIKNLGVDFCKTLPDNAPRRAATTGFDIHKSKWTVNGKVYNGFLDIIKKEARDSIMHMSEPDERTQYFSRFNTFWEKNVDPYVKEAVRRIRRNYKDLLVEKYRPAFVNQEEREYNDRKFQLGVFKSMEADAMTNLKVLAKVLDVNLDDSNSAFAQAADDYMKALRALEPVVSNIELFEAKSEEAQSAYDLAKKGATNALEALAKESHMASKGAPSNPKKLNDLAKGIGIQAYTNLESLIGEMDSYFAVVKGIKPVGY